jgi:aspartate aminotransferase-like enzyme
VDRDDDGRLRLFTPGPVDLSGAARRGLARDIIHHRSTAFERLLSDLEECLKALFLTTGRVATLTSSGTGAMEAAVVSLFSPGERVIVPVSGKFSARWAEICDANGIEVRRIDLKPGEAADPADVVGHIEAAGSAAGVLLTQCETSTGSLTDVPAVCAAMDEMGKRRGGRPLTCVDCVTSLAIDEFRMDDWHVDCAIGASQKGMLGPPGLAFVAANAAAVARMARVSGPRYYFDLRKYFDDTTRPPFTPAVPLVSSVRESIQGLLDLGLPALWRAYRASAAAIRLMIESAGLRPVAASQAGGVVAFWLDGLDAESIARDLLERHGIVVAQGQGGLRGKILRVSAMGKGPADIRRLAGALVSVVGDMGRSIRLEEMESRLEQLLEDTSIWESLP